MPMTATSSCTWAHADSRLIGSKCLYIPPIYDCMVYSAEDIYESIILQWVNYILGLIKTPMTATVPCTCAQTATLKGQNTFSAKNIQ